MLNYMKAVDKNLISRKYYNHNKAVYVQNWIESCVILRNICAHHGRIIGRQLFKIKQNRSISNIGRNDSELFITLLAFKEMLLDYNNKHVDEWCEFVNEIQILESKYDKFYFDKLDFPNDWFDIIKQ